MSKSIIPSNKIMCYITGKLRNNTPEEKVRQIVARSLVEEYGYDKKDIDIEFSIKVGSSRKRLDIVIFDEGENYEQKNIFIIVEVKKEKIKPSDKTEGLLQLESYVSSCLNCKFALWIGSERLAFKVVEEAGKKKLQDIPDLPKKGQTTIPVPTRGDLVPAVNLKQEFKRIHNYIYANQGLQKDKAFEELLKLIFIKVFDEQYNPKLDFYILPGEDVNVLKKRLQEVFKKVQRKYKYIFKGNESIELNDRNLSYVVSELQRFSLVSTRTDVKGEAYEEIVGPNLRGDRGEFFTPRNMCEMTVEMLFTLFPEEILTTPGDIKILDPASGTGGFLIAAIQKIKRIFEKRGLKYDELRDMVRDVSDNNIYGIDFNPFLVKVAQMNMVMHGDGSANIYHANSLENWNDWDVRIREKIPRESFDVVLTNPPFGTKLSIDDTQILSSYELTDFGTKNSRTSLPPEILFIEKCLDFLKTGGYIGIVLPDSILSNPGLEWLREWILKKTFIIASIDLPVETFEPHTGTQTSILILKKKTLEQQKFEEDYEIFMAIPEKVGHDRRGNPLFKKTPNGNIEIDDNGEPLIDDHLPIISEIFKKWLLKKGMI